MKNTILSIIIACLIAIPGCTRPEGDKAKVQQKIETPTIQMSEPVTSDIPDSILTGEGDKFAPEALTQPSSATILKSATNVEIIVDASGSMNGLMGQTTKMGALKSALNKVLSTPLPSEMANRKLALRVFGNKYPSDQDNCRDTNLLLPMGPENYMAFSKGLEEITPQGTTPLAFSIEEAYNDFEKKPDDVDNLIILIADGPDACNGDIKAAAERLHNGPGNVIVDIIGFDIDQATQNLFREVAEATDGHFYFARTDPELVSALDQAISTTLPYNLRVKVMSGATPLPSTITVYRANTQSIVDRAETEGIKFFKLNPGSYDILVRFDSSFEATKPSKMIKGIEVQASTKAEQIIQFDLGTISLNAIDQKGQPTLSNFYFRKSGTDQIVGRLNKVQPPQMVFLSPGAYDIDAESADPEKATLSAYEKNVEVKNGETIEEIFKFQTGKLLLKAQNLENQAVPVTYKVTKPDSEEVVSVGEGPIDGVTLDLAPGNYDIYVTWVNPNIEGGPEVKLPNISINGGETLEQVATFKATTLTLSGKDSQGKIVETEFSIRTPANDEEAIKVKSLDAPVNIYVTPGKYNVIATNTSSKLSPQPSLAWNDYEIKEGKPETMEAVFQLGTLKLLGKNAKEMIIPTAFTLYRAGIDEPVITEEAERSWLTFSLTPGLYDIKAEDLTSKGDQKSITWVHDIEVKAGESISKEAIFTSGKLKLICRGTNNVVLACSFKVFTYGSDTALFEGSTADEWRQFDIPPGKYYMEAGFHDPKEEQFLKKWINLHIGENQIVEKVIRF